jgi:hypothetical protein
MHNTGTNTQEQPLKTILVMVLGFMGLAYFLQLPILTATAAGIGVLALMSGRMALLLHHGWMGLAGILGKIFPPVFMGIIYFCVLTPIGLMATVFGKKEPKNEESNFISNEKRFKAEDLRNMW